MFLNILLNDYYSSKMFRNFNELNATIVQDFKRITNGYENYKNYIDTH